MLNTGYSDFYLIFLPGKVKNSGEMKKTYSTIILLLGIGLGGILFAQQSANPDAGDKQEGEKPPEVKIHIQKDTDEDGNMVQMDSLFTWTWSWDNRIPEDFQDRLQDIFEHFEDGFSFYFNDSTLSGQRFHKFFNEDFSRKLEDLQNLDEKFDEDFLEKLNEKLEGLQDLDIQFQWDENFNRHLETGIQQMFEKWQEFYEDHQEDLLQPRRKAL